MPRDLAKRRGWRRALVPPNGRAPPGTQPSGDVSGPIGATFILYRRLQPQVAVEASDVQPEDWERQALEQRLAIPGHKRCGEHAGHPAAPQVALRSARDLGDPPDGPCASGAGLGSLQHSADTVLLAPGAPSPTIIACPLYVRAHRRSAPPPSRLSATAPATSAFGSRRHPRGPHRSAAGLHCRRETRRTAP